MPTGDYIKTMIEDKDKRPRAWLVVSLVIVLCVVGVVYYFFDPMESRWMPRCLFHELTGWQCIGCGSQRMAHALLHGRIADAFRANVFALLSLPAILFMIWTETQRTRRPRLYARVFSPKVVNVVMVAMVVWLVVRNLIGI